MCGTIRYKSATRIDPSSAVLMRRRVPPTSALHRKNFIGNLSWIFLFAFFIKMAWRSSAMRTGNGVPSKLGTPPRLPVEVTSVWLIVVGL